MYSIVRVYKGDPATLGELARRVGETGRELITTIPGFISYAIAVDEKETLLAVGHYDDKAGADESTRRAATWVRQNGTDLRLNPPTILEGQTRIRRVASGVQPKSGAVRRYAVAPGSVDEIIRRGEEGFAPIISKAPGFGTYSLVDAGNGTILSISSFESQAQSENANRLAADWVKENIGPLAPKPPEITAGQIKVLWRK